MNVEDTRWTTCWLTEDKQRRHALQLPAAGYPAEPLRKQVHEGQHPLQMQGHLLTQVSSWEIGTGSMRMTWLLVCVTGTTESTKCSPHPWATAAPHTQSHTRCHNSAFDTEL